MATEATKEAFLPNLTPVTRPLWSTREGGKDGGRNERWWRREGGMKGGREGRDKRWERREGGMKGGREGRRKG